jgi:hypothetical protein
MTKSDLNKSMTISRHVVQISSLLLMVFGVIFQKIFYFNINLFLYISLILSLSSILFNKCLNCGEYIWYNTGKIRPGHGFIWPFFIPKSCKNCGSSDMLNDD